MQKIPSNVKAAAAIELPKIQQTHRNTSKLSSKILTDMNNIAWKKCKEEFKASGLIIERNAIVMAKMQTYSAWPAKIEDFSKDGKRAHLYFFGTHNTGTVGVSEIVPFYRGREVIRLLLLRRVGPLHLGILEVERLLKVPPEESLTNEVVAIKN